MITPRQEVSSGSRLDFSRSGSKFVACVSNFKPPYGAKDWAKTKCDMNMLVGQRFGWDNFVCSFVNSAIVDAQAGAQSMGIGSDAKGTSLTYSWSRVAEKFCQITEDQKEVTIESSDDYGYACLFLCTGQEDVHFF